MNASKRIGIAAAVGAVLVALGIAAVLILEQPSGRDGSGGGIVQIGGPFELVDQSGKTVTDRDFRGKYMLIYFGYSYCPDVCPTELSKMGAALDELGASAQRIVPIFITIDPARDTPSQLAAYVPNFYERLVGLTGSEAQIAQVAKAYRIYYRKAEDASSSEYLMDHSSIIYLMGPDGKYVTHFSGNSTADEIAARLKNLS